MRSIFEKLGAQVSWDKNTNVVTATKDGKKIEIKKTLYRKRVYYGAT